MKQSLESDCRKFRYKNQKKAEEARIEINAKKEKKLVPGEQMLVTSYKCDKCGYWHNSTKTRRQAKLIAKCIKWREQVQNPSPTVIGNRLKFLESLRTTKTKKK